MSGTFLILAFGPLIRLSDFLVSLTGLQFWRELGGAVLK
jgi:hypothetical protein